MRTQNSSPLPWVKHEQPSGRERSLEKVFFYCITFRIVVFRADIGVIIGIGDGIEKGRRLEDTA